MSSWLLIGVFGVLLFILFKGPIIEKTGENNKLVHKLKNATWFQNHWLAGLFLFFMNGFLFSFACLGLYVLMYLFIPFVHLFVMLSVVIVSLYLWILVNKAWQGTAGNRLKMGAVGSSFYVFLILIFIYWFVTLTPSYPGEDTFMGAVGLIFAIIVSTVAFITGFVITGFSKKKVPA
ncbi:hypothetical protein MKZ02_14085 [Pseudobacillus sp. FSL P4-0506]|uniref:hypothetical protein n=1 Tax=unclassified Pseudobacillus TaxID=2619284 RepID=UPI0030FA40B4